MKQYVGRFTAGLVLCGVLIGLAVIPAYANGIHRGSWVSKWVYNTTRKSFTGTTSYTVGEIWYYLGIETFKLYSNDKYFIAYQEFPRVAENEYISLLGVGNAYVDRRGWVWTPSGSLHVPFVHANGRLYFE